MKKVSTLMLLVLFVLAGSAAAQINEFKLTPGDTYLSTSVMDQEIVQTVMGTDQTITTATTTTELIKVIEATAEGFTLESTTQSIKTEISNPMMNQVMDSEGSGPQDAAMKAITGKTYTFKISKTGEILEITGLDEIRQAVTDELAGTPLAAMSAQLTQGFSEETIRQSLGTTFTIYPQEPAEEWSTTRQMVLTGTPADITTNFTRVDAETISFNSKVSLDGDIDQGGMKVNLNLSGATEGKVTVNTETGMVTMSESKGDMAGFATAQGMEIPMSISIISTSEIVKQ
jgi:hypothetical protein